MSQSEVRFRSRRHPGDQGTPVVFGIQFAQPIAATMLPVMILAVVLVLEGQRLLPFIWWAAPVAVAVAAGWTWYRMRSLIVELVVTHNGAAALTVLESLRRQRVPRVQRVFDVRSTNRGTQITIGLATYTLEDADWPQLAQMVDSLEKARKYYQ